jgi:hypothetical protein
VQAGFGHGGDQVDDAVRSLAGDGVAEGVTLHRGVAIGAFVRLGGGQDAHLPRLAFVVGKRHVAPPLGEARRLDAFLTLQVPGQKEPPAREPDAGWPLIAAEVSKDRFGDRVGDAAVAGNRLGHEALDVGALATESEDAAIAQEHKGGVAPAAPPAGIAPSLTVGVALPEHGLRPDRVARDIDATGRVAERIGDRLGRMSAHGRGEDGKLDWAPGGAMIIGGGPLKRKPGVQFVGTEEQPETPGVVPEQRRMVVHVGQIEKQVRRIPRVRAEAQAGRDQRHVRIGFRHRRERDEQHVPVARHFQGRTVVMTQKRAVPAKGAKRPEVLGVGVLRRGGQKRSPTKPRTRQIRTHGRGRAGLSHAKLGQAMERRRRCCAGRRAADHAETDGMVALIVEDGAGECLVEKFTSVFAGPLLAHALGRLRPGGGFPCAEGPQLLQGQGRKVGGHAGAVGDPGIVWGVFVQSAPAHDPRPTGGGSNRIGLGSGRILAMPIGAPFGGTAEHGAQSPGIRPRVRPGRIDGAPGPRRVLPLRLRRQAVRAAFLRRHPGAEGHRIVPTDARGRPPAFRSHVTRPEDAELFHGHFAFGQKEGAGDRDFVARMLIPVTLFQIRSHLEGVRRRRAGFSHPEGPSWHGHQPQAERVGHGFCRAQGGEERGNQGKPAMRGVHRKT